MLPEDQLSLAIEIQNRAFALLKWAGDSMTRGAIPFRDAIHAGTPAETSRQWILSHHSNLPSEARPAEEHLEALASFFATYLTTSFDFVEKPGQRLSAGRRGGWCCSMCAILANLPHLQVKYLDKSDKERAAKLRSRRLVLLAAEHEMILMKPDADRIAADPETRRDASFSAYGASLIERMRGITDGPAVLALWRDFAWKPEGSPNPKFRLKLSTIIDAEIRLLNAMPRNDTP
jgi:hypothetical protein